MPLPEALQPFKTIREHVSLAEFSYMKVGGKADYLAIASTKQDLLALVSAAVKSGLRFIVLGGGSNVIFSDAGYRGLVIINRTDNIFIDETVGLVRADAGVSTNSLVNQTISRGLSGLELFLGVPGTVGGAIYNNSHYLNQLIGDRVNRVYLLPPGKSAYWANSQDMDFAYDYSKLHRTSEIVVEVEFLLKPGHNPDLLAESAKAALKRRKDSQPMSHPSSGCMFQNPATDFAGALIDKAGLKGSRVGGAEVSHVHANFIVNTGHATASEVIALSTKIIDTIRSKYGITLKPEVFMLDEYGERIY